MIPKTLTALALGTLSIAQLPQAQADPILLPVIQDLHRPVWMEQIPDTEHFVIIQQYREAILWDRANNEIRQRPFLDISDQLSGANEQGILSLVFSPNFQQDRHFYIYFTDNDNRVTIQRWQASGEGDQIHGTNPQTILQIEQPYRNHNGGWMDFGPDNKLYISVGDGGAANDPPNNGQDLSTLLGTILRIDVLGQEHYAVPADNPFADAANQERGIRGEIWAYGLRNAWRCSWDRDNDQFWIADVGQNRYEEINALPHQQVAGKNFGWRLREGNIATPTGDDIGGERPRNNVDPVYVYRHGSDDNQGISVTGGVVYRGHAAPELQGRYLFADYQNNRIWSLEHDLATNPDADNGFQDHTEQLNRHPSDDIRAISSFCEDQNGELYVLDHTGNIFVLISQD